MPGLYAYVNLGQIRLELGNVDKALAALDAAIEAIDALSDAEKKTYARYVPEIEKLKTKWAGGGNDGGNGDAGEDGDE